LDVGEISSSFSCMKIIGPFNFSIRQTLEMDAMNVNTIMSKNKKPKALKLSTKCLKSKTHPMFQEL
jgi:ribosomal protein L28